MQSYIGRRILALQSPSRDEMGLQVETGLTGAPPKTERLKFRRFGSDRKVVMDEDFIRSSH